MSAGSRATDRSPRPRGASARDIDWSPWWARYRGEAFPPGRSTRSACAICGCVETPHHPRDREGTSALEARLVIAAHPWLRREKRSRCILAPAKKHTTTSDSPTSTRTDPRPPMMTAEARRQAIPAHTGEDNRTRVCVQRHRMIPATASRSMWIGDSLTSTRSHPRARGKTEVTRKTLAADESRVTGQSPRARRGG